MHNAGVGQKQEPLKASGRGFVLVCCGVLVLYPISYILADIGDIESYFLNPISYIAQDDGYIDSDVLYPISYIQIDIENT